jgi:hypothetical protein
LYKLLVIGSAQWASDGAAPQQELPPLLTRRAASPYFSFTTILISVGVIVSSLAFAEIQDFVWLDGLCPSATFGKKKRQQFLKGVRVNRVPQETPFSLDRDDALVLELFEMMREVRCADAEFRLDLASDHPVRVRRQKKLSDPKPMFGSDGGKHVGKTCDVFRRRLLHSDFDISIIVEM